MLHIGAVKTGSSALQSALVRNRDWLRSQGVLYPSDASDADAQALKITSGNGMKLASALNPNLPFAKGYNAENAFNEAVHHATQTPEHTVLYSSEQMSFLDPGKLQEFNDVCQASGIELKVIFFFRNITEHAYSSYNQMVKRHLCTDSFGEFAKTRYFSRFAAITNGVTGVLGVPGFIAVNYDNVKSAIFGNFMRAIGIDPDGSEEMEERVNRSLSRIELEVMRVVNKSMTSEVDSKFVSDAIIYNNPEKRTEAAISEEERDFLVQKFRGQVNEVNGVLGAEVLTLISDDVSVAEADAVSLSEAESAYASMFSALYKRLLEMSKPPKKA
ncbi:MAG: hypothetical protein CMK07_03755 [Ponticaulis sp.]|nr:hypothetical protein [Ponticaulis sp.]